jgi:hypothetical protein
MCKQSAFLLPLCLAAALSPTASANLLDQPLSVTYRFPDAATVYPPASFEPSSFVVGPGLEAWGQIEHTTLLLTDFSDNQLTITFRTRLQAPVWTSASFNGLIFQRTTPGNLAITGATVDPATTLAGFDTSRISYTTGEIRINWGGLPYVDADKLVIDFTVDDRGLVQAIVPQNPVPELGPASIAAAGLLTGWMLLRRRNAA